MMVPEMEKPKVTEIMVRMDCNGCVQKVKKALHGITGIYDMYVDFPQQKLTVIGWADPETIVKAIKKTRKTAIICSHTEQQPDEPPEQEPEGGAPLPEEEAPPPESNPPPTEPPQTEEVAPPPESQNQPPPPEVDNPPPENEPAHENASQHNEPSRPRDHEEIHVVYHHPPDSGYRYTYGHYVQQMGPTYREMPPQQHQMPPQQPQMPQQPQPFYVTHSYNSYRPSHYVTEYSYPQSPPQYSYYSRPEPYSQVYYNGYGGTSSANGNITSMFSEENPNACTIV